MKTVASFVACCALIAGTARLASAQPAALDPPARDDEIVRLLGLGDANGCFELLRVQDPNDLQQAVTDALAAAGIAIGNELRAICGTSAVSSASSMGGGLNTLQATKTMTQFRLVRRRLDSQRAPARPGTKGTKPSRDLLFAFAQQPPSPALTTGRDAAMGLGVFGEIEREQRDRVSTAYENAYESDLDSLSAGVDFAGRSFVVGGWAGRSRHDAMLSASSVLLFCATATGLSSCNPNAEPSPLELAMRDAATRSSVCGGADAAGSFEQRSRRFGLFAGIGSAAAFVDGAITWSRRDHEYTRGVCAVEGFDPGSPLLLARDVEYLGDLDGDNTVDDDEFRPSPGRGVLFVDQDNDEELSLGDQAPFDDIYAGTLTGAPEIRETAYSVRVGGDVGSDRVSVGPRATFTYTRTETDAYVESGRSTIANLVRPNQGPAVQRTLGGPTGLELAYDEQSRRSMLLEGGAEIAVRIGVPFGLLVPHASGFWRHEFDDDPYEITARMAQDRRASPSFFTFGADAPDADTAVFAGGITALVGRHLAARFEISQLAWDDIYDSRIVSLQARWQF
jgi:hypothetical protein